MTALMCRLAFNGHVVAFKMAVGKAVRAGLAVGGRIPHHFYPPADLVLSRQHQNGAGRNRSGGRRTALKNSQLIRRPPGDVTIICETAH
jgi:hypothetical protein